MEPASQPPPAGDKELLCRNHHPTLQRSFPSPRSEARGEDVAQRPERGFQHHLSPALSPNCVGGEGVQLERPPLFRCFLQSNKKSADRNRREFAFRHPPMDWTLCG